MLDIWPFSIFPPGGKTFHLNFETSPVKIGLQFRKVGKSRKSSNGISAITHERVDGVQKFFHHYSPGAKTFHLTPPLNVAENRLELKTHPPQTVIAFLSRKFLRWLWLIWFLFNHICCRQPLVVVLCVLDNLFRSISLIILLLWDLEKMLTYLCERWGGKGDMF